jgi:putative transposase
MISCGATSPAEPNRLRVANPTEYSMSEGKLYLAVVVDAFSYRCGGWATTAQCAELVVEALEAAIWHRRPDARLVHHSDRGSRYS